MATRQGNRGPFVTPGVTPVPEGDQTGFNIDRNSTGATLKGYTFRDFKTVVRQESASASATDVLVDGNEAYNVGRFWETTEGQETYNATSRNNRVVGFERASHRWRSVRGGLIEGGYSEGNQGGLAIVGVQLESQCINVTIRDHEVRNVFDRTDPKATYFQGDGFSVEGGQNGTVLQNLRAIGCGDGGYDLKTIDMDLLGTLYAEDCGRGFRFHRVPRMSTATLTVKAARGRALWFAGQTSQYPDPVVADIGKVIAMDPNGGISIFRFESGPATIRVLDYDIYKGWRGKLLQENGGSGYGAVTFPNGGRVQQDDGSWVAYPGAPPTSGGAIL